MTQIVTIDKDGQYFMNTGLFRQVMVFDQDEKSPKRADHPLDPGVIYRVQENAWLKAQVDAGVVQKVKDPMADAVQEKAAAVKEASDIERNGPKPDPAAKT